MIGIGDIQPSGGPRWFVSPDARSIRVPLERETPGGLYRAARANDVR